MNGASPFRAALRGRPLSGAFFEQRLLFVPIGNPRFGRLGLGNNLGRSAILSIPASSASLPGLYVLPLFRGPTAQGFSFLALADLALALAAFGYRLACTRGRPNFIPGLYFLCTTIVRHYLTCFETGLEDHSLQEWYFALFGGPGLSQPWRSRNALRRLGESRLISMLGSPKRTVYGLPSWLPVATNFLRPYPGSPLRMRRTLATTVAPESRRPRARKGRQPCVQCGPLAPDKRS